MQRLGDYKNHISGYSLHRRIIWWVVSVLIFESPWPFFSSKLKRKILVFFGAKIGDGLVIKPNVKIKYPWLLEVGEHCWIGEFVWIDNLDWVRVGNNVCISQGVFILTGNHNYNLSSFDLFKSPVTVGDQVWLGAKCILTPGVILTIGVVVTVGSIVTKSLAVYGGVYKNNELIRIRNCE